MGVEREGGREREGESIFLRNYIRNIARKTAYTLLLAFS